MIEALRWVDKKMFLLVEYLSANGKKDKTKLAKKYYFLLLLVTVSIFLYITITSHNIASTAVSIISALFVMAFLYTINKYAKERIYNHNSVSFADKIARQRMMAIGFGVFTLIFLLWSLIYPLSSSFIAWYNVAWLIWSVGLVVVLALLDPELDNAPT